MRTRAELMNMSAWVGSWEMSTAMKRLTPSNVTEPPLGANASPRNELDDERIA